MSMGMIPARRDQRDVVVPDVEKSSSFTKQLRYVLFGCGCVGFALAKSLASGGQITIDQIEFLIIGSFPLVGAAICSKILSRTPYSTLRIDLAWLFSLMIYIFLQSSLLLENLRMAFLNAGIFREAWVNVIATLGSGGAGMFFAATIFSSREERMKRGGAVIFSLAAINVAIFYVLIFIIPPGA